MKTLLLALLALSSCGAQHSSSDDPIAAPAASSLSNGLGLALQGSFNSDCKYMMKLTLKNEGTLSELVIHQYLDDLCEHKISTMTLDRLVSIPNRFSDNYNVDFTYQKVTIVMEDSGESKDITGQTYDDKTMPVAGQKIFQNWQFDDGKTLQVEQLPWLLAPGAGVTADHRGVIFSPYIFTKA